VERRDAGGAAQEVLLEDLARREEPGDVGGPGKGGGPGCAGERGGRERSRLRHGRVEEPPGRSHRDGESSARPARSVADQGGFHQVQLLGEGIAVERLAKLPGVDLALAGSGLEGPVLEEVVAEAEDVELL
jgi:hypothetical protein